MLTPSISNVNDTRPLSSVVNFPLDRERLGVGLGERAVDDRNAVAAHLGHRAVDRQRLTAILAKTLGIGMRLGARGGLEELLALIGSGLVPMFAQGGARHVVQVEIGLEHPQDPCLARLAGFGHDEVEHPARGSLDEVGSGTLFSRRLPGRNGKARPDKGGGCTCGQKKNISAVDERHDALLMKHEARRTQSAADKSPSNAVIV